MACECELSNTLDVDVTQDSLLNVDIAGSAGVLLQKKSVEIKENGISVVTHDDGFDGLKVVEINTNTPKNITGVIDVPDGIPLARVLLSDVCSSVTEINDSTEGWILDRYGIKVLENLQKVTIGCTTIKGPEFLSNQSSIKEAYLPKVKNIIGTVYGATFFRSIKLQEEFDIPELESVALGKSGWLFFLCDISGMKKVLLPKLYEARADGLRFLSGCPDLEDIYIGPLRIILNSGGKDGNIFCNLPKLKKAVFENFPYIRYRFGAGGASYSPIPDASNGIFKDSPDLIYLDLGYADNNVYLNYWSPTLDDSNLQQFLSNFKTYIADRLTDKGTGLTITLSQEVRNAIHAAEDEYGIENIIITKKGWTISPAPN